MPDRKAEHISERLYKIGKEKIRSKQISMDDSK